MSPMTFVDRTDAGRRLAERLMHRHAEPVVVLGLARGGVPVAAPVAIALGAPLDVLAVRRIPLPDHPEVAMGALAEGGVLVMETHARLAGHSDADLEAAAAAELATLAHEVAYRDGRAPVSLVGSTAIVVDDGLATGATARAACLSARARGAARVVLAVPVAPPHWSLPMHDVADECLALHVPAAFHAVSDAYDDFAPTSDDDVLAALAEAAAELAVLPDPLALDRA